jgi:hypothetical protein
MDVDEKKPITRTQWIVTICSALALAVMCAVIVLATPAAQDERPATRIGERPWRGDVAARGPRPEDVAGAAAGCSAVDTDNPPEVRFELPAGGLDFGALRQGVKLDREVTFENAGRAPLCVYNVSTGCGCLAVEHDAPKSKMYAPGEKGTLKLTVDTTGRQGIVRKRVTLLCNDPRNPRVSFAIQMDISAGLMAEPRFLDFGNASRNRPVTKELGLRSPKDEPTWKVIDVQGARKGRDGKPVAYTFDVEEVPDPRFHRVRIQVTHPGSDTVATVSDTLVVRTTHPERPHINVPSRINVVPRIMCRRNVISLGYVRSGSARPPTRTRIQAGAPGVEFEITGVEVEPQPGESAPSAGPGFVASFGRDNRGWWVDVKYDGKSRASGLLEAVLVIHTDDGEQPELRVPIRATIRS